MSLNYTSTSKEFIYNLTNQDNSYNPINIHAEIAIIECSMLLCLYIYNKIDYKFTNSFEGSFIPYDRDQLFGITGAEEEQYFLNEV